MNMGKLLLLTLNEQEETAIDKIISAISNYMRLEPMQLTPVSVLSFPGLEIRQSQRRVFQDGEEVNLTRLEYNALVFLASNPGIVLTRTQIFEAVWNMESDTCHSSVANVIYNLRKKIEPDSRKPTYIKDRFRHRLQVCFRGITTEQPPPTTATYHDRKSRKGFLFFCAKKRADFPALSKSFLKKFPKTLPYLHFSA